MSDIPEGPYINGIDGAGMVANGLVKLEFVEAAWIQMLNDAWRAGYKAASLLSDKNGE